MFFLKSKKSINNKGFGIIEALVGITIGALLLVTFSTLIAQTIKINRVNAMNIKAMMYLQEMIEVAKDLEQSATATIFAVTSPCTNCHPCADIDCHPLPVAEDTWGFNDGLQTVEVFTRSMTISPVSRDPVTHQIKTVYDPANDATSTKIATATISWYDGSQSHTKNLETYLYYYGQ